MKYFSHSLYSTEICIVNRIYLYKNIFFVNITNMNFKSFFNKFFNYNRIYDFSISNNLENDLPYPKEPSRNVSSVLDENLDYLKSKYSSLLNSDVIIREFTLNFSDTAYKAFIIFIDGLVNANSINDFILKPLMLIRNKKSYGDDLLSCIDNCLLPQNSVEQDFSFEDVFSGINMGDCLLFVDTLNVAFDVDVKSYSQRSIDKSDNEIIIKGPQEAFVENLRTNTSLIRRIINNENLVIENIPVGQISKTKCGVCYIKDITNTDLVEEVKYRLSNLKIDSLLSTGQLEQLIEEDESFRRSSGYFYRKA